MAVKRRLTTYQYEPLVTPSKWQGDELRFSVRLTQILDDLYQKFSSLRTGSGSASVAIADDANKLGGIEASKYALKTGTVANAKKLGGKAPEYYLSPRNLLDNSDFRNPVNQRGITTLTASGHTYTIDRWYSYAGLSLTVSPFSFSGREINQLLEGTYSGRYTLAAKKTDGTVLVKTAEISNAYSWSDSALAFGVSSGNTRISIPPGEYEWAALYEGEYTAETLPPYVPKPYVGELAECQRYYVRLKSGIAFYGFVGSSGSNAYLYFDLPQQMRISNPTATTTGRFFLRGESSSVSASTISNVVTLGKQIEISVAVSMTANKPFNGYAESAVEVSSDL